MKERSLRLSLNVMEIYMTIEISGKNRDEMPKEVELHPNYQLLRTLSKRGILDDQLIIRLQFF